MLRWWHVLCRTCGQARGANWIRDIGSDGKSFFLALKLGGVITLQGANILLMEEILHQLRLVVYPPLYKVLYIPGGAGFLPSTVSHLWKENHRLKSDFWWERWSFPGGTKKPLIFEGIKLDANVFRGTIRREIFCLANVLLFWRRVDIWPYVFVHFSAFSVVRYIVHTCPNL